MPDPRDSVPAGSADFYRTAMRVLQEQDIPFLVAGAYAFGWYTGVVRYTKDFDLFIRERDLRPAMETLAKVGDRTEADFAHWIGKVHRGDESLDLIYGTANGIATVDDEWFERAPQAEVLDLQVQLCPPEELLWTKAFIMERERYDGADVAHLLRAHGPSLDWPHLLRRFGRYWRVLLSHLVLFQFIYPDDQDCVPAGVVEELTERLVTDEPIERSRPLCRGTLLSRDQYRVDVEKWSYLDARLPPHGDVTPLDAAEWTDAGEQEWPPARDES